MLNTFYSELNKFEAGIDEAGRGCLAGPVVAAAVILPQFYTNANLNDSKKLTNKMRMLLRNEIEKNAIATSVAFVDVETIDKINILNASILAMNNAIDGLKLKPDFLLIDGNRFKTDKNIDYKCIVKGDSIFQSIAAASILAKTYRDDFMNELHENFEKYCWNKNKGYPTEKHLKAIKQYGITIWHRRSFRPVTQLTLEFY